MLISWVIILVVWVESVFWSVVYQCGTIYNRHRFLPLGLHLLVLTWKLEKSMYQIFLSVPISSSDTKIKALKYNPSISNLAQAQSFIDTNMKFKCLCFVSEEMKIVFNLYVLLIQNKSFNFTTKPARILEVLKTMFQCHFCKGDLCKYVQREISSFV